MWVSSPPVDPLVQFFDPTSLFILKRKGVLPYNCLFVSYTNLLDHPPLSTIETVLHIFSPLFTCSVSRRTFKFLESDLSVKFPPCLFND